MNLPSDHTIFRHLSASNVPLLASANFGSGFSGALWNRNERVTMDYLAPNHHTLSLYVTQGQGFRKRVGNGWQQSNGSGDLCVMPQATDSRWDVNGPIQLFHLYITPRAFDRAAAELFDTDPRRLSLREEAYFRDPGLERLLRQTALTHDWAEPADRVAITDAAHTALAWLLANMTDVNPALPHCRGGLAPIAARRVTEFIAAHMAQTLSIDDMAGIANLSAYHFARAFRQSFGETPHGFVTRQRIERAKAKLKAGEHASHVARECGFSSHSHFSARFRAATGMTPSEFVSLNS